jgi:hypothetical protein
MKRRLHIPARLELSALSLSLVSLLFATTTCSQGGSAGPVSDAGPLSDTRDADGDVVIAEGSVDTSAPLLDSGPGVDAATPRDATAMDARPLDAQGADVAEDAPRVCVQSVGEGGTIDLSYLDGAPAGSELFLADGATVIVQLDGAPGGQVVANEAGMEVVEMPGPCTELV